MKHKIKLIQEKLNKYFKRPKYTRVLLSDLVVASISYEFEKDAYQPFYNPYNKTFGYEEVYGNFNASTVLFNIESEYIDEQSEDLINFVFDRLF